MPALAGVGDGVGERAQVVAPERGPHLAVVVVQEAHAALEVGVGLGLDLVDRHRPALGPGVHRLGVPVRALHQPHGEGHVAGRGPGDHLGQVVAAVLQVGLDHHAGVDAGELGLGEQLAGEAQREVLDVGVLHVDVDVHAETAGQLEDRPDARLGTGEADLAGQRFEVGGEGRRLDRHVDAGQRAEVVALEVVVGRPARGRVRTGPRSAPRPVPRTGRPRPRRRSSRRAGRRCGRCPCATGPRARRRPRRACARR